MASAADQKPSSVFGGTPKQQDPVEAADTATIEALLAAVKNIQRGQHRAAAERIHDVYFAFCDAHGLMCEF